MLDSHEFSGWFVLNGRIRQSDGRRQLDDILSEKQAQEPKKRSVKTFLNITIIASTRLSSLSLILPSSLPLLTLFHCLHNSSPRRRLKTRILFTCFGFYDLKNFDSSKNSLSRTSSLSSRQHTTCIERICWVDIWVIWNMMASVLLSKRVGERANKLLFYVSIVCVMQQRRVETNCMLVSDFYQHLIVCNR